uniref:5'-nucleotidase SurE n=1 Tax=candidate division WOR-3 bacterium TaxID=2052148 RepID=A0A7C4XG71_UNCW3
MGLILLTNDDGYDALGFQSLYKGLIKDFEVFVSVPRHQQSGASHSLTLRRPIRVEKLRENFFIVDGTPTDCVLLAYHDLIKDKIDMVISGINHGPNMGSDVFYSGTVAAALQAATLGIKNALAVSLAGDAFSDFTRAVNYTRNLIKRILSINSGDSKLELKSEFLILNVNIPQGGIKGERITRMGRRIYKDKVIRDNEKNGVMYSVIDGVLDYKLDADTDFEAVEMGYVSLTPLKLDLTNYEAINELTPIVKKMHFTP